jgi:hypothetical protein
MNAVEEMMEAKMDSLRRSKNQPRKDGSQDRQRPRGDEIPGGIPHLPDPSQPRRGESQSAIQYRMEATTKCSQEETEAAIQSIQAELEETVRHWVEDVCCVSTKGRKTSARNLTRKLMKRRWTYRQ